MTTTYAMETALESASVALLLGEDSVVSIGEDEDCDCADQDGLSMENVVSVARLTRSQVIMNLASCDK